jgi:hypothetical protein
MTIEIENLVLPLNAVNAIQSMGKERQDFRIHTLFTVIFFISSLLISVIAISGNVKTCSVTTYCHFLTILLFILCAINRIIKKQNAESNPELRDEVPGPSLWIKREG